MAKNYYLILGISEDASREDIRAAFRRRALELHPDRSGMESGPFQALQEAYSVLGDPERRRRYDRERGGAPSRRSPAGRAAETVRPRRPKGEPLRPAEPFRGFREVSLTEPFQTYRPSFEELFDWFWSSL
jgi:molecular chaperone DnaJ